MTWTVVSLMLAAFVAHCIGGVVGVAVEALVLALRRRRKILPPVRPGRTAP